MGHYYAEMFPNGKPNELEEHRIRQEQTKEIENKIREITNNNTLTIDDIVIGDKLKLLPELFKHENPHPYFHGENMADYVKEYKLQTHCLRGNFWMIRAKEDKIYEVFDIKNDQNLIRLNKNPNTQENPYVSPDLFQVWCKIDYFVKDNTL